MSAEPGSQIDYEVFPLSLVFDPRWGVVAGTVRRQLDSFSCARSTHIEKFARESVHRWEKNGNSRTYVLITTLSDGTIRVPGFFTVGMTSLDLSRASNAVRKKLMGDISFEQTGAFSIAELARADDFSNAQLPGSTILDEAKSVIKKARGLVGGRFLVVDSRKEIFERLYRPAGFREVDIAEPPPGMEDASFVTSCAVIKDWTDEPGEPVNGFPVTRPG